MRLLRARQPIEKVLADPDTPDALREQLDTVEQVRSYAAELGLDVGERYTSYVDWPGDRIVTIVVATRPGEVVPTGWSFPIVGRVPYKGFFDPERASAEAERLRERGRDVCQVPVPAYSTLGWFDDPVTGPMLRGGEGRTVETLIHELVHATVYVADDSNFNEGVASFVGEEGSVRFFAQAGRGHDAETARHRVEDWRRVRAEMMRLRARVGELYADDLDDAARAKRRTQLADQTREAVRALDLYQLDAAAAAETLRLNDACLALVGTYEADVDRYGQRLAELGGDLRAFVAMLREAAGSQDPRAVLSSSEPNSGTSPETSPR
jgi:predicted aminopeptidase